MGLAVAGEWAVLTLVGSQSQGTPVVTRQTIGRICKRAAACAGAGLAAAALQLSGLLDPVELWLQGWFMAGTRFGGVELPLPLQLAVICGVALVPAIVRIEHPFGLAAYGIGSAFIYMLIYSVLLLTSDVTLPATAALLGLGGATLLQGTLSWSEERRRRRHLEAVEAARRQFTDMLVHDLKRRMSSILMSLSVLEDTGAVDTERRGILTETIRASAERMLLLTGNLLDIRKMEECHFVLHREPVDIGELVRICLREHRGACDLSGVAVHPGGPEGVRVDADRGILLRVLANLLWNALQHAPEGSVIELGWTASCDTLVALHVANRGSVIPPGDLARVFTAFIADEVVPENSLVANTGLGLTFCKLAVEAHGGAIKLASPWPGHDDGVRVDVTLPAAGTP